MKKELWLRLHRYRFENLVPAHLTDRVAAVFGNTDATTHAFAAKLAHKQRWTTSFALRAIAEYKKYVYLGIVADFSVTPPKAIDAVWHEHLLFSRAYRDFCREVLGREFDHHPELLPERGQTDVFQAQYDATLVLYLSEFNAEPPADVWGTPKFDKKRRPTRDQDVPSVSTTTPDDAPLYTYFDSASSSDSHSGSGSIFGGGGGFSGSGGGSDWSGDSTPHDASSSDASGSSDGGGSSCSGGSGCSSSCGGSD